MTKWQDLCDKKWEGGLGFRDLGAFNDAMLAKQVWRLFRYLDSLVCRVLKAKYFPEEDVLSGVLGSWPSYTWRSICGAKWVVERGSRWLVGNGESINVWKDRWVPRPCNFKIITHCGAADPDLRVSNFINADSRTWDRVAVVNTFWLIDAEKIFHWGWLVIRIELFGIIIMMVSLVSNLLIL